MNGQPAPRLYEVTNHRLRRRLSTPPFLIRRRWTAQADGKYFLDHWLGASHEFTFGYMWERETEQQEADGPLGEIFYWFNSPAGSAGLHHSLRGLAGEWSRHRHRPSSGTRGRMFQDQIRIKKRAALTVGFRWDYYRQLRAGGGHSRRSVPGVLLWRRMPIAERLLASGHATRAMQFRPSRCSTSRT